MMRDFKRRYATRFRVRACPWAEAHGYRQMPLCGNVAVQRNR